MSEAKKKEGKISGFWNGLKAEFKRIIWPDKASVVRQTITVTVITIIVGIIIAIVDATVMWGIDFIIGL